MRKSVRERERERERERKIDRETKERKAMNVPHIYRTSLFIHVQFCVISKVVKLTPK